MKDSFSISASSVFEIATVCFLSSQCVARREFRWFSATDRRKDRGLISRTGGVTISPVARNRREARMYCSRSSLIRVLGNGIGVGLYEVEVNTLSTSYTTTVKRQRVT